MIEFPLSSIPWKFCDANRPDPRHPATVPGCVHRDLLQAGLIPDPFWGTNELQLQWIEEKQWEYSASFDLPSVVLAETEVDLVCDGLDTCATVYLNGHEVARTDNMFVAWRWPVKPKLVNGANEIRIVFASALEYIRTHRPEHRPRENHDPVGRSQVIRKEQCQFGWDWGPRFVTAGIWKAIRLEGWSENRIETIHVRQTHHRARVKLTLIPELAREDRDVTYRSRLIFDGSLVAQSDTLDLQVADPLRWWPNDHGDQPLYDLDVEARKGSLVVGRWRKRIGLRTIKLDRHSDAHGESFQFVVNGRPIFAKGANWVPAHAFVAGLKRADYSRDLVAAAQAHMNMIRVWGGGIYESEDFYDLCDELGLLVWQDFMFACSIYPGDPSFLRLVESEAAVQIKRLRHRACLALWCGNNEVEQLNGDLLKKRPLKKNYRALFHDLLPGKVAALDGATAYWPSSEYRNGEIGESAGERQGDTHYWGVWHSRNPARDYENHFFRFVSEFGMQSYPSPEVQATFCSPEEGNVFGPAMENHQKNRAGNRIILDYVCQMYRFPRDQAALSYLSQLNQAYCMQVGVEHYRRNMPRCMGAIYWQLNDCWPVASWSSIEFTGRWKALHHVARRFFAPALVSVHVPGGEEPTIGNYRRTTIRMAHLYTVYDAPNPAQATLFWEILHLDGRRLTRGSKKIQLRYGESVRQHTLQFEEVMNEFGRDNLYLRTGLQIGGDYVSGDTTFLAPPRFLALPKAKPAIRVRLISTLRAEITLTSPVFLHRVKIDFRDLPFSTMTDNYFDLYPKEAKTITVIFVRAFSIRRIKASVSTYSLSDSYA